jgi:hypothetical protein
VRRTPCSLCTRTYSPLGAAGPRAER